MQEDNMVISNVVFKRKHKLVAQLEKHVMVWKSDGLYQKLQSLSIIYEMLIMQP